MARHRRVLLFCVLLWARSNQMMVMKFARGRFEAQEELIRLQRIAASYPKAVSIRTIRALTDNRTGRQKKELSCFIETPQTLLFFAEKYMF